LAEKPSIAYVMVLTAETFFQGKTLIAQLPRADDLVRAYWHSGDWRDCPKRSS
jgi:hypothetical protein